MTFQFFSWSVFVEELLPVKRLASVLGIAISVPLSAVELDFKLETTPDSKRFVPKLGELLRIKHVDSDVALVVVRYSKPVALVICAFDWSLGAEKTKLLCDLEIICVKDEASRAIIGVFYRFEFKAMTGAALLGWLSIVGDKSNRAMNSLTPAQMNHGTPLCPLLSFNPYCESQRLAAV